VSLIWPPRDHHLFAEDTDFLDPVINLLGFGWLFDAGCLLAAALMLV
jgi:hypothetical protein